jgi:phosphatidylserine/phosphatidylglycerophosphate/cardiolipin synthase-like enzyme
MLSSFLRVELAALAIAVALGGCASLPKDVERPVSSALSTPEQTSLGRAVIALRPPVGTAGLSLIPSGSVAYEARLALIDRAERTIDLQYFIVSDDQAIRGLLEHVQAAAARGVRVRLLVDDLYTTGKDDWFTTLSSKPNVEVRVFNPFPVREPDRLARAISSLADFQQLNRRMHNKMFIVDNAIAICGGRNLASEYFARNGEFNFVDLDLLIAGNAVRTLSRSFDAYWNNDLSYPIASLRNHRWAAQKNDEEHERADEKAERGAQAEPQPDPAAAVAREAIASGKLNLTWAPVRVLADPPSKITTRTASDEETTVAQDVLEILRQARKEVVLISPYFIPGKAVMDVFRELRSRGVAIRVLTNSLATTEMAVAQAGYMRRRPQLLRLGVELHELKPDPPSQSRRLLFGQYVWARASLHTKAIAVDRHILMVGSMNLDPRSKNLNTEDGLLVGSPQLAAQLVAVFVHGASPESSYEVRLGDKDRLEWVTRDGDQERRYDHEPETRRSLRALTELLEIAAPENQL